MKRRDDGCTTLENNNPVKLIWTSSKSNNPVFTQGQAFHITSDLARQRSDYVVQRLWGEKRSLTLKIDDLSGQTEYNVQHIEV